MSIFYIIRYKEQKDQSLAVAVGHQHILVHLVPDMGGLRVSFNEVKN